MNYYCCAIHQGIFSMKKSSTNIPIAQFPGGKILYVAERCLSREKVILLEDKEYPIKVPVVLADSPEEKGILTTHKGRRFRLCFLPEVSISLPRGLVETSWQTYTNLYYDSANPLPKGTALLNTICLGEENTLQPTKQKILEAQGWAPVCTVTRSKGYNQDSRVIVYLGERG